MFSSPKITAAFVAALALVATNFGASAPANAAGTMTPADWNASAGTIALHAAMDKNDAHLLTLTGLNLTMTVQEDGTAGKTTETDTVSANKTSAIAHYLFVDNETNDRTAFNYYFNKGTYLESTASFQTGPTAVNDLKGALSRLGKPKATTVNDHTAKKLSGLTDISPTAIWANAIRDPFAGLAAPNVVSYGEVTSAADATTPTSTVYICDGNYSVNIGTLVAVTMHADFTFNADGLMTAVHVEQHAAPYYDLVIDQTIAAAVDQTLIFPGANETVDASALISMGHRIDAEKSLTKNATAAVAKAKGLAKAAKKGLAPSHLIAAAKALKLNYKSIKNGIRLSAVSSKVTGSLCLTAVKNKGIIAPC